MTCEVCPSIALFGIEMDHARFCYEHRAPEMHQVAALCCRVWNCMGGRLFESRYCLMHSEQCERVGCSTRPAFGQKNGMARFCAVHKEPDMVCVLTRKCETTDCTIMSMYGMQTNSPRACAQHKQPGMIRVV